MQLCSHFTAILLLRNFTRFGCEEEYLRGSGVLVKIRKGQLYGHLA